MSLHKKIFLSFFFVALLPFFILLYISYDKNTKLAYQKLLALHEKSLDQTSQLLQEDISQLKREMDFLSSLNLMDDLVSEDVDKRILELLRLKQSVFTLKTQLSVKSKTGECIASTNACLSTNKGLFFTKKIYLSFQAEEEIGTLEVFLPYESLRLYLNKYPNNWCLSKNNIDLLEGCEYKDKHVLSREIDTALSVKLLLDENELQKPILLLRKELIIMALFSFLSFIILFFFVSRAISKPVLENEKLISQQLKFQENEVLLLEQAKHSAQTKARFISQISHDFRTPLNSIIGFSQFLDQEKLVDQEYAKLPKNIEKAGKHLLSTVNQVLDFSKAENEDLVVVIQELELRELCQEVIELIKPLAEKKSLALSFESEKIKIKSDESILKNILINLLNNAVKFTKTGSVRLLAKEDENDISIHVVDTGIGITQEEEKRLFLPFTRFTSARGEEGSGLGLALCLAYARSLGMQLSYKPHNSSSEFILVIPKDNI